MNKIRKGDQVIVLTGRDKGKRGTVLQRVDDERLVVEGVNVVKKHVKPNPMKGTTGGVVDKTLSIHQSNVAIFNAATGKADRVGIKLLQRRREEGAQDVRSTACASSARAAKRSRRKRLDMARLQEFYREKVVPDLVTKFGYKSTMQVPRITKITLNMGVSEAVSDKKVMDHAVSDLTKIAGQKPVVTKSKKAIAGFKIRDGVPIGCMVTLRGVRMYEFLDRFVTVALPRVRDFRGISGARVRRPRQLQHRRQGTDHLPRDRVRQDRRAARPEHQHHDDREDRRRVQGAAHRVQVSVQELKDSPWPKLP